MTAGTATLLALLAIGYVWMKWGKLFAFGALILIVVVFGSTVGPIHDFVAAGIDMAQSPLATLERLTK